MLELIRKEVAAFFSSLSGYVILACFLIVNGLFLWVIPGVYNIPGSGLADLQPFFSLAPILYLFLVPALCMRLFAEEKRSGTLELLFTRPVSRAQIVFSKYAAGFGLVFLSLLPTLVYPVSLYLLAQPVGNVDLGGMAGSYIGLLFLSALYVAAGVWASAVTDNQIVAFLCGMAFSFLLYAGFDFLGDIPALAGYQGFLISLGIDYHYEPMSRGVIALGDVLYFLSVILLFLGCTVYRFKGIRQRFLWYLLAALILLNSWASGVYRRWDITDDKRYTLSENTRNLLEGLERPVEVDLFLAGNLPPGIQKLQYATTRMLEEFRRITGNRLNYRLIDPTEIRDPEEKKMLAQYLTERGIMPLNLNRLTEDETFQQQILFPGLVVYDDSTEVGVPLLQNLPMYSADENINHSAEALEYELTKALRLLIRQEKKSVAFLVGQGELPYPAVSDAAQLLQYYYQVDFVDPDTLGADPERYHALIIAKPSERFTERDKYIIDQYVMRGGRVLWCVDEVEMHHEALQEQETVFAMYRPLNIEDLLFKYGIRINPEILVDGNCVRIPVVTGMNGTTPVYTPAPWYYWPLLYPTGRNPVTAGIQPVKMEYANTIDTIGGNGLKKTALLASSRYSGVLKTPSPVSLAIAGEKMTEEKFNRSYLPVAVLVEGSFQSMFRYNRRADAAVAGEFQAESGYSKMIVVADGDVIRNEVKGVGESATALPLGYDEYGGRLYGNRDFILNSINLLCDDEGWMQLRGRHLSLYLLNTTKLKTERKFWQALNLLLPLCLITAGGALFYVIRRRRYRKI
ncbi:MAG: gliding motility-associated ABC transporter substrate-binding protein GldG [Culturomica sp.]|jgi:ABC-2 type transport system permease protein|nr:gliding motility-associated ABC transporter substrate-binding protein GldG [Culturomica sp.]